MALEASGMTLDELRANTRRDLTSNQVIGREVTSRIEVSDEELRASYRTHIEQFTTPEQRFVKEIIVLENSPLDEQARAKLADDLYARLSSGEDLDELAGTYKELGQTSGVIDLGWLEEDEPRRAVGGDRQRPQARRILTAGTITRRPPHSPPVGACARPRVEPFEDVQDLIVGRERQIRFGSELREYLSELERDAYIVEDLPPDAVGYRGAGRRPGAHRRARRLPRSGSSGRSAHRRAGGRGSGERCRRGRTELTRPM